MIERQLQQLNPYSLSRLLGEGLELAKKCLMFFQSCSVVSDISVCHLNITRVLNCQSSHQLIMSEVSYQELAAHFKDVREKVIAGKGSSITISQLEEDQAKCTSVLESMSIENKYDHFEEVANFQDIYRQMRNAISEAKSNNQSKQELNAKLQSIFGVTPKPQEEIREEHQKSKIIKKPKREQKSQSKPNISSSISQIRTEEVMVPDASKSLDQYFKKKENQISQKDRSFKKILDSKQFQQVEASKQDISKHSRFTKSHLKSQEDKQLKLRKVIDQHKKALNKLQGRMKQQQELNDFQKNLLREEKNRYLSKVEELEQQIQQLARDNYRLKEMDKTAKESDSFGMGNLDEKEMSMVYEPYVIKTRHNDLNRIDQKNKQKQKTQSSFDPLGQKLQGDRPLTAQQFFNKKPPKEDLYAQKFPSQQHEKQAVMKALLGSSYDHNNSKQQIKPNESFQQSVHNRSQQMSRANESFGSLNNGSRFDTFHMANTLSYINDDVLGQSRNMAKISSQTATRNKVAFFKNSLVLVRDAQLDIAYKKSDLNPAMDKIRFIFYINNKTPQAKRVKINYEVQKQYFSLNVQEKLNQIPPGSQGRQVIEITLISKTDLNGVTDMHVEVGDASFDLWLPVSFIRFKEDKDYRLSSDTMEMTVLPDRQFANFSSMQEVVPVMFGGHDSVETWAYLVGQCKFGKYAVKVTWKVHDLTIETTEKWLDFIGFVFHFFK